MRVAVFFTRETTRQLSWRLDFEAINCVCNVFVCLLDCFLHFVLARVANLLPLYTTTSTSEAKPAGEISPVLSTSKYARLIRIYEAWAEKG